jgi:hypothetical protein
MEQCSVIFLNSLSPLGATLVSDFTLRPKRSSSTRRRIIASKDYILPLEGAELVSVRHIFSTNATWANVAVPITEN